MTPGIAPVHQPLVLTRRQISLFWSHVDERGPDECWLWTGTYFNNGHACMSVANHMRLAKRLAWSVYHNQDPGLNDVRQSCHDKRCMNHLYLVVRPAVQAARIEEYWLVKHSALGTTEQMFCDVLVELND